MIKIFIFCYSAIILSVTACNSSPKEAECEIFKSGRFRTHSEFDNTTCIINRNDSIQTETNTTTGSIIKEKIIWTGDCEYNLVYLGETSNSADTISPVFRTRVLKTKILKATKDYCIFQSSMTGISKTLTDTLSLIK